MHPILEQLARMGVVPVIQIDDPRTVLPLAQALIAGGLPCAEITFRTAHGEEAIRQIAAHAPQILVGAGTVLTPEQAGRAIGAGAKFVVSPGWYPEVASFCAAQGVPVVPGCATPTELGHAVNAGLALVKFFPAAPLGGISYLKAVSAPFPGVRFMATGGISEKNLGEYLASERVAACGGSWMVDRGLLAQGRYDQISALCARAAAAARAARGGSTKEITWRNL